MLNRELPLEAHLRKGYLVYLFHVKDTSMKEDELEEIPVVKEFVDVFRDEIPEMAPVRELDFKIDLVPGTRPILKAPYRMLPAELQELKV